MPEIANDLPAPACFCLHFESGIKQNQRLGPDLFRFFGRLQGPTTSPGVTAPKNRYASPRAVGAAPRPAAMGGHHFTTQDRHSGTLQ
jgi:hypothetical protein